VTPVELGALGSGGLDRILQQYPALSHQAGAEFLLESAHPVDRLGGMGDHVELVEGDLEVRQMLPEPADEGSADRLDLRGRTVMGTQFRLEGRNCRDISSLDPEDHASLGRIRIGIGEAAADLEVNANMELPLVRFEVHPAMNQGLLVAQGCLKDLLSNHSDLSVCCEPESYRSTVRAVPPKTGLPSSVHRRSLRSPSRLAQLPKSAGPSAGCGTVDNEDNQAISRRITQSKFNRARRDTSILPLQTGYHNPRSRMYDSVHTGSAEVPR